MKVAFIVTRFPSLSQTFVLNQITGFIDLGHDVEVFANGVEVHSKLHEDIIKYNLLERTCYYREIDRSVPKDDKFFRIMKGVTYAVKSLPKGPLSVLKSLNIFRYGRKAASLNLLFLIIPFLKKGPYDIIHCQFATLAPTALLLKQIGVISGKIVVSFRGFDATKHMKNRPGIYNDLFRSGDLFLPVSQTLKRRLIEEGCDKRKILVHRSGIDCAKIRYSERRRAEGQPTKVLTIARLVEKKGVAYAIQAVARLIASGRQVIYSIVGDGVLRSDLERLIEDLGVASQIRLLGWRNHDEVIRLLQHAHLLMAPSVTATNGDQEGIPNALKEAMASGLPVIGTHHGGTPELVEDGVSGFLVPERDVDALTARLAYLIDHPERWPEMGYQGRSHVQEHYDINKLNNRLEETYKRLIKCNILYS